MDRRVSELSILEKFVNNFVSIVEKHCKYVVVSGFVAIAHGRTRGTEDIDIIIERLDELKFYKLHNDLLKKGFVCVQADDAKTVCDYLKDNLSVRYIKKGTFVPEMEVKFTKDSLDEYQIQTRKKLPLSGLDIYFSTIEMNIASKEELLKSEKDMEDAKHLREVYSDEIDENEINKIKKEIKRLRLK
ncbi:hypothetical protein HYV88_03270 [Candidatus Woesearchaeota archaeon]|nr:hypothetical protein [Candidatus Woesearchaeota archaeon]